MYLKNFNYMKKIWPYISAFLAGTTTILLSIIILFRNKISSTSIEISRPKIKNSPDGFQQFTSEINKNIPASDERKIERQQRKLNKLKNRRKKNET